MIRGENTVATVLAVGRLASDRFAAVAARRRLTSSRRERLLAEHSDIQAAAEVAERVAAAMRGRAR